MSTTLAPLSRKIDAEFVIYRLEEAGTTLLSLPSPSWSEHVAEPVQSALRDALTAYGWTGPRNRPHAPTKERRDRMAETFAWLDLIPDARGKTRTVVMCRALVTPTTKNYLFTFPGLGKTYGFPATTVKAWHTEGVRIIVEALRNG